ncbi:hypothetical protein CsatB_026040 [Cannabis sativa]
MALQRSLVVRSRRRALSIVHASRSKTFLRKIELSAFSRSTNPFPRDLGCFGVGLGWAIGDGELGWPWGMVIGVTLSSADSQKQLGFFS